MNFKELSDRDFELLAKDILEKYLKKDFQIFAKGRDGGVDIKGFSSYDIIGQAKHYYLSSFSALLSELKKEKEKIEKINPLEYYVFVSKDLSLNNIECIKSLFGKYMADVSHIFDLTRIEGLLKTKEYGDILIKHTKLWFFSSEILKSVIQDNVNFDSLSIDKSIQNSSEFFVRTTNFWEADNFLSTRNVVILLGDAGVGKTITSEFLARVYNIKGFETLATYSSEIDIIKDTLSKNPNKKYVILIDDFLGQRYLELRNSEISQMKTLISYALRNSFVKLILNSRITILNSAQDRNIDFENMTRHSKFIFEIDMNRVSKIEKAQILIALLRKHHMNSQFITEMKKSKSFFDIINHKNYTPRVIESMLVNYQNDDVTDIKKYILTALNNTYLLWDNEFSQQIEREDRLFILIVYSLSNKYAEFNVVMRVYNHLISNLNLSASFEACIKRLNSSFINIHLFEKRKYICLKNPSINDFLDLKINSDFSETLLLLKHSVYFDQIYNIYYSIPRISEFFELSNKNIFEMENASMNPIWLGKKVDIYSFVYRFKIKRIEYKKYIIEDNFVSYLEYEQMANLFNIYQSSELYNFYSFGFNDSIESFTKTYERSSWTQLIDGMLMFENYTKFDTIGKHQIEYLLSLLDKKIFVYFKENLMEEMKDALYQGAMWEHITILEDYDTVVLDDIPYDELCMSIRDAVVDLIKEVLLYRDSPIDSIKNLSKETSQYIEKFDYSKISKIFNDEQLYKFLEDYIEYQERLDYEADMYMDDFRIGQKEKESEDAYISSLFEDV